MSSNYHLQVSPPSVTSWTYQAVTRIIAAGIGGAALWTQVNLTWEFYAGASATIQHAVPIVSVTLALSLVAAEYSYKQHAWGKVFTCAVTFVALTVVSLSGTLGRVSEYQAQKAATADGSNGAIKDLRKQVERAQEGEKQAKDQILKECRKPGPSCKYWTGELARRQGVTATWEQKVAAAKPKATVDATYLELSLRTGLSEDFLERWVPALLPIGLEIVVILCFWIACAPLPKPRQPTLTEAMRRLQEIPAPPRPSASTTRRSPRRRTGISQSALTAKVGEWLLTAEFDELPVGACYVSFERWANLDEPVSIVKFGQALDACGMQKRRLNGRVVVRRAA